MTQDLATIEVQEQGITRAGMAHTAQQLELLTEFVKTVLVVDQDYGVIPGTGSKPTLLKPGAANVVAAFECYAKPRLTNRIVDPVTGFASFESTVEIISKKTGQVVAEGIGECNSYEVKYRYREEQRKCPDCNQPAIIKGKAEYGGGWLCWSKKGGCGAKFNDGAPVIEGQKTGRIDNPDPLDQMNTMIKMSVKRAEVDAAMRLPGVARFFTQDLDQIAGIEEEAQEEPDKPEAAPRSKPRRTSQKAPEQAQETAADIPVDEDWEWVVDAATEAGMTWGEFELQVLCCTKDTFLKRGGSGPDMALKLLANYLAGEET